MNELVESYEESLRQEDMHQYNLTDAIIEEAVIAAQKKAEEEKKEDVPMLELNNEIGVMAVPAVTAMIAYETDRGPSEAVGSV